jgi:hypothetical protein
MDGTTLERSGRWHEPEDLTVTMAMDDEIFEKEMEPARAAVGLGELQIMRLLLDTCANVDEAKEALMATKQYYQYVPVRYRRRPLRQRSCGSTRGCATRVRYRTPAKFS